MIVVFHIDGEEAAFEDDVVPHVGNRIQRGHSPDVWIVTQLLWVIDRAAGLTTVHVYTSPGVAEPGR